MTTYTLSRLSDRQAQKELATQRRYMQRHRAELADTRNPDALRRYMEFNRLSIICAGGRSPRVAKQFIEQCESGVQK